MAQLHEPAFADTDKVTEFDNENIGLSQHLEARK